MRTPAVRSLLFLLAGLPACVLGNGVSATREFDVLGAAALDHRTFVRLEVRRGPKAQLSITCDENLLGLFRARVEDQTLIIDARDISNPLTDCEGVVELPALEQLVSAGSGAITVRDVFPETRSVEVDGSGSVTFSGPLRGAQALEVNGSGQLALDAVEGCDVEIDGDGSGDITLASLDTGGVEPCAVDIELSGSGGIRVDELTTSRLEVFAEGSGTTRVAGRARNLLVRATGSGDVRDRSLVVEAAQLDLQGSGSVEVTVTESLRVRITGSGDALIAGQPELRDIEITGSGELRAL